MEWFIIAFALLGPIGALYWLKPSPARRILERTRVLAQQKGFQVRLLRKDEISKRFDVEPDRPIVEYTWRVRATDPGGANARQAKTEPVLVSFIRKESDTDRTAMPDILSQYEVERAVYAFTLTPTRAVLIWTEQVTRERAEPFLDELISLVKRSASAGL
ncbi:hypothetical protein [Allohahella marinimesophila]|uniref:Uncharacterized protein n=1 Tax=Allohahella marinimesophila TaxID=1054972 RepID=A0ABP7QAY8_9GAMM